MQQPGQCDIGNRCSNLGAAAAGHPDDSHVQMPLRNILKQRPDRAAGQRVLKLRGDFSGRLQHKPPGGHPRVRELEPIVLNHPISVKQQIKIDAPRPPPLIPSPIERILDGCQHRHEVFRPEARLNQTGGIEEGRLPGRAADRPGFDEPAHLQQIDAGHEPQNVDGLIKLFPAAAQVRATADQASHCRRIDRGCGCHSVPLPPLRPVDLLGNSLTVAFHRRDVLLVRSSETNYQRYFTTGASP